MELHLTPSDIGKELGCTTRTVNQLLIEAGLQTSFRDAKRRVRYEPTEKGVPYAVFKDTGKKHGDGTPIKQLFWKRSVVSLLKKENVQDSEK